MHSIAAEFWFNIHFILYHTMLCELPVLHNIIKGQNVRMILCYSLF